MSEEAGEQPTEQVENAEIVPPPTTLLTLPDVTLLHTLNFCDYLSLQSLRKTCKFFRALVDESLPDSKITDLSVIVQRRNVVLMLTTKTSPVHFISFHQRADGCYVGGDRVEKKLPDNSYYLDAFFIDLEILIRHCKSILEKFVVFMHDDQIGAEFCERFHLMMMEKPQLKTKCLHINGVDAAPVLSLLPHVDPEYLTFMNITGTAATPDFSGILALDHWQKVARVHLTRCVIPNVFQDIGHLEVFKTQLQTVMTATDIRLLKDMFLLPNTNLKEVGLCFDTRDNDEAMTAELGEIFVIDPEPVFVKSRTWYFKRAQKIVAVTIDVRDARLKICDNSNNIDSRVINME
ncbi:hypothetical protein CRE_23446 [Caenorhabditis remanei]|uniref:F-box domain-containing protein n=1 Tax=Caenorhabditis remanei TaxID=31234 RepID=E3MGS9_CAERE|nr:hypothetical protein CRE_23446 [Caenorhabditis remanei]